LNNSNNDCDWLIERALSESSTRLTPLLVARKTKFGLKIQPNAWGNYRILYHKTNKEALGSGISTTTVVCVLQQLVRKKNTLSKKLFTIKINPYRQ